jgi:pimeloyl-ACP methyl ester carboxylesterase
LPGLGNSSQTRDRDYSVDNMAEDLHAVVSLAQGPVILVGHSIGGMINLSFCRKYPSAPVAEPVLYSMIGLSPVQVDFVSRYEMLSTPSVVARGALGMFHWDGGIAEDPGARAVDCGGSRHDGVARGEPPDAQRNQAGYPVCGTSGEAYGSD